MNNKLKFITVFALISLFSFCDLVAKTSAKSHNRYGVSLGQKRKFKKAQKEFDIAIKIYDKNSSISYHNRGWIFELQGDYEKAIASYKEAWRRSPKQIATGEKLAYLYYKTEKYNEAIVVAESVLKIDSKNSSIPKWLPDAYMKRLAQQKKLEQEKARLALLKEKKKKDLSNAAKAEMKKNTMFDLYADFMIRSGYYFNGGGGYKYVSDNGMMVNFPWSLRLNFEPNKHFLVRFSLENPFLGALTPDIISQNETIDASYRLGNYMLGIGMTFNHYSGTAAFSRALSMSDMKVGFIFGYKKKKSKTVVSFYPRYIPHDGESSSNFTMDYDMLRVDYSYEMSPTMKYYSIFSAQDYYVFNHTTTLSDYWGVYQFGLGMSLGDVVGETILERIKFTIEFVEKIYTENLQNTNPYGLFNGQGFMGMDGSKWFKGSPFSGYKAMGHQLSLIGEEGVNNTIILYQKFIFEMGDLSQDHHEFNFQMGANFKF